MLKNNNNNRIVMILTLDGYPDVWIFVVALIGTALIKHVWLNLVLFFFLYCHN